jgi:hypothetical protein
VGCVADSAVDSTDLADTVVVHPEDLNGELVVESPKQVSWPDWKPGSAPIYGSGGLAYDNGSYHVYKGTYRGTFPMDVAFTGPEGDYWVIVNDTFRSVTIARNHKTRVVSGRIEVSNVNGTFEIDSQGDWSGDIDAGDAIKGGRNWLMTSAATPFIPTGVGINVLPGSYEVKVAYQEHVEYFPVQVADTQ